MGILVLNYGQPEATFACIAGLLARESGTSRILWIENPAGRPEPSLDASLAKAPFPFVRLDPGAGELPPPGTVGLMVNRENLGYGAGNNVGLRLLHRAGVPFAWILNNDTTLLEGDSGALLAQAAAEPRVAAWSTGVRQSDGPVQVCQALSPVDFSSAPQEAVGDLDGDRMRYLSGCSLFCRVDAAAEAGFIPEDYFLYYEDAAFCLELRAKGHGLGHCPGVVVGHAESLATGKRSPLVEYYTRRNRWMLLQRYFPEQLERQRLRRYHTLQKFLFRGRFDRLRIERRAYRDFLAGKTGRA
ncbi:MAG TPA: glycosyltransferase family 2 protein [Holophagaceae bacterium]|nr:glycosyltransferase family 2 protein [Holophagaceae bacterium]